MTPAEVLHICHLLRDLADLPGNDTPRRRRQAQALEVLLQHAARYDRLQEALTERVAEVAALREELERLRRLL